jgi:hypothetical protein
MGRFIRANQAAGFAGMIFLLLIGCGHERSAIAPAGRAEGDAPGPLLTPVPDQPNERDQADDPRRAKVPSDGEQQGEDLGDARPGPAVWGILGLRGYPIGDQVASNGEEFRQLFSLDLNFNLWLCRSQGLYLFSDARFWGQKAAPGITNPRQGSFDFSKREFDLDLGGAWNYYGNWEARAFAYSFNNLNRGTSAIKPTGFNDGVGLENRYYVGPAYAALGTPAFDPDRTPFVSLGYYPTKTMVDGEGLQFKPGPFARVKFIWDLIGEKLYLFTDDQLIAEQSFMPKLFLLDAGVATRPFVRIPRLEFRVGTEDTFDLQRHEVETSVYGSVRYTY